MEYRPQVGESVRAMLVSALGLPAEALASGIEDTVEGVVISTNEAKGTIVVRDNDGEWDCLAAGAFPLPTQIVAARLARDGVAGAWEARFKGSATPIGYGATKDEAVGKLTFNFPSRVRGTPEVEERTDPVLEGR